MQRDQPPAAARHVQKCLEALLTEPLAVVSLEGEGYDERKWEAMLGYVKPAQLLVMQQLQGELEGATCLGVTHHPCGQVSKMTQPCGQVSKVWQQAWGSQVGEMMRPVEYQQQLLPAAGQMLGYSELIAWQRC